MLMLKLALRNLFRHPVKTSLLGGLIAIGMAVLLLANGIFDSSTQGLEKSLVGSLTGHFAVSALTEEAYGLFGSEVPIVSDYESIPPIADIKTVETVLRSQRDISVYTPIVSSLADVRVGSYSNKSAVFGVTVPTYFQVCSDLTVVSGDPESLNAQGVFLNENWVKNAEKSLGRKLIIGEDVIFSLYQNNTFRVRRGSFAGIYRYPAPSEVLDRIVLTNPVTVRALCNYTLGVKIKQARPTQPGTSQGSTDINDLFSSAQDVTVEKNSGITLQSVEKALEDTTQRDELVQTDSAAWSFVLARVDNPRLVNRVRNSVNQAFEKQNTEVRVLDWYTAAGTNAMMLFAIRTAFSIGIGFVIFGALLVIMNGLVISVLERTAEIGSMRALGAPRSFIRNLFIIETLLLTLIFALLGLTVGTLGVIILQRVGIPLSNPLLVGLFGGNVLKPHLTVLLIFQHLGGALAIGFLAWIYPVSLALKIPPVSAMGDHE
jgi:putative ABC transport system permease protein